jgi:sec-independent protein translocase protein TatA
MGFGGVSVWELLIILLIVVLLFGSKRLGTLGADLGGAIRGFRRAMEGKETLPAEKTLVPTMGQPKTAPTEPPQADAPAAGER